MAIPYGIDLGTTYSAISYYDENNQTVVTVTLETADGANMIRSVVYYPGNGQAPVVGETAWNAARQYPERVILGIKRSMGQAYRTPPIDGVEYTPPEVSAEILKVLARDAQIITGEPVKDVVITVPAYFGDNERAATLEAGKLAGLNVLALLPEPHAAALTFAINNHRAIIDRHLLVYDLGGGTFDVTLIRARTSPGAKGVELEFETLCKDGNASLGGLDFDKVLSEIVAEKAASLHGVDVLNDAKFYPILLDNCEKAKRHLTRTSPVSIVATPAGQSVEVTVAEFEDRTRDLILATQMLLERVLDDAAKPPYEVVKDRIDVLPTGGSSRMPMAQNMIKAVMGREPLKHGNPELLVTLGAAYWAHLLQSGGTLQVPDKSGRHKELKVGELLDVASYAIGVEALQPDGNGRMKKINATIIPRNSVYGQPQTREFCKSEDGAPAIRIAVLKGEDPDPAACEELLAVEIDGLPPDGKQGDPVRVTLRLDSNGIIQGEAVDVLTGKKATIHIDRSKVGA